MKNSSQHWVPISYLNSWRDPDCPPNHEPYVWRINKDGSNPKRKSPRSIFREADMYTRQDAGGRRDLSLEHWLSKIETDFSRIVREALTPCLPLSDEARAILLVFLTAAHSRSRQNRDHWREQWGQLDSHMEKFAEHMRQATPEQKRAAARISAPGRGSARGHTHGEVKAFSKNPLQYMLPPMVAAAAKLLTRFKMTVLCTTDFIGFITSDTPCVWYDPMAHQRPPIYRSPALMYSTTEITMPITPSRLVVLSRHDSPLSRQYRLPDGYLDASMERVDEHNRRTRFHCDEHFVSNFHFVNPVWLDPGVQPPDFVADDDSDEPLEPDDADEL
jgi:uncharacterized protein DUF4238